MGRHADPSPTKSPSIKSPSNSSRVTRVSTAFSVVNWMSSAVGTSVEASAGFRMTALTLGSGGLLAAPEPPPPPQPASTSAIAVVSTTGHHRPPLRRDGAGDPVDRGWEDKLRERERCRGVVTGVVLLDRHYRASPMRPPHLAIRPRGSRRPGGAC